MRLSNVVIVSMLLGLAGRAFADDTQAGTRKPTLTRSGMKIGLRIPKMICPRQTGPF